MTDARVTTKFSASSTSTEVMEGVDLTGRRAVVTGGASGIGAETTLALARAGARVTVAIRNLSQGDSLLASAPELADLIDVRELDLTDIATIHRFAEDWDGPLDLLINNAGIMVPPERVITSLGAELQFATNHLGHFELARLLHPALAAAEAARIVALSSTAHLRSPVVFEDLDFSQRPYDRWLAYGQSKTANALFVVEAARRWADDGIIANAVNPGVIDTPLMRHWGPTFRDDIANLYGSPDKVPWKSVPQGAATTLLVATSDEAGQVTGRYFEDCNEAAPHIEGNRFGIAGYASDPQNAARLWSVSEDILG